MKCGDHIHTFKEKHPQFKKCPICFKASVSTQTIASCLAAGVSFVGSLSMFWLSRLSDLLVWLGVKGSQVNRNILMWQRGRGVDKQNPAIVRIPEMPGMPERFCQSLK